MIYCILIIILQLSIVFSIPQLEEHELLKKTIEGSRTVSIENVKTCLGKDLGKRKGIGRRDKLKYRYYKIL